MYVRVGYQQLRAFGVAAIWNYGQTFTTGAGAKRPCTTVVCAVHQA